MIINKSFIEIKKNLKKKSNQNKRIKVALLGDSSTQILKTSIDGFGYENGLNLEIWESDYNQISLQILNPKSNLYDFDAEIIILFRSTHKLLLRYNNYPKEKGRFFANNELEDTKLYFDSIFANSKAKVIVYNYPEINDGVFGNFSNKVESSFLFQLRKLNYYIMDYSKNNPNLFICDLSSIQNQFGKEYIFHTSSYVNASMTLSIDSAVIIGQHTINMIKSLLGRFKKCLILDLDNTIWGGVIGDDGIEKIHIGNLGIGKVFTEFQQWIVKLKNRGIIITVCSKNNEEIAKEPFKNHPDMVLKLDDISVFIANWENKADNIRQIQNILNISFDSMVFIDDNPFEREIVKTNLPDLCVPEMPTDPANYLEYLYSLNLFETASFSKEDAERNKKYQVEAKRNTSKAMYTDENEFLKSLNMYCKVESFNEFNTPRVSQLTQRSNQFNLRTKRYTEGDIINITNNKNNISFVFQLTDKFGDYGIISIIILEKINASSLFIDTWLMSCRVLKRNVEKFALNTIVEFSKKNNIKYILGEYLETKKNIIVRDHYKNLGFRHKKELWQLEVNNFKNLKNHIKIY